MVNNYHTASTSTDDMTGPQLTSFSIDMTSRVIVLSFDEPIDPNGVDVTGITIQGTVGVTSASLYYQLTSTSSFHVNESIVRILLSSADFDALQLRQDVATMQYNTFLSMEPKTATDRSNQRNMAQQISNANALQAAFYIADTNSPQITSLSLNLETNTMALTFNEPVLVSSFAPYYLTVSSSPSPSFLGVSLSLTGGLVHPTMLPASRVISFTLIDEDIIFLKVSKDIATGRGDTYITASVGLVNDTSGNQYDMFQTLSVSSFIFDTSAPMVVAFDLDLNVGALILEFDDVVDATTFDESAITLQSAPARQPMEWHTLSGASVTVSPSGSVIAVLLSITDLNQLQLHNFCTLSDNCYLTVTASVARDPNGVDTIPISDGSALSVRQVIPDATPPLLVSFSLNINIGVLSLTFDEIVNVSTFSVSEITLVNQPSQSLVSYTYTFIGGSISNMNNAEVHITLINDDLNTIRAVGDLATSPNDTYIIMTENTVTDLYGNVAIPISGDSPLQVSYFVDSPILVSFEFSNYSANEGQTIMLRVVLNTCLLYTSPSPRDATLSRMPSSA